MIDEIEVYSYWYKKFRFIVIKILRRLVFIIYKGFRVCLIWRETEINKIQKIFNELVFKGYRLSSRQFIVK